MFSSEKQILLVTLQRIQIERLATSVFCLATQSIQPRQRTRQLRPLNAQPESAVIPSWVSHFNRALKDFKNLSLKIENLDSFQLCSGEDGETRGSR